MSTATTASIGNRSDINAAHAEPYVSGMMRRINGMMERGIARIQRRNEMEREAREALRETQRQAALHAAQHQEAKVIDIKPTDDDAENQAKSTWTIKERVLKCAQSGMTVNQAMEVVGSTYKYVAAVYRKHGIEAPKPEFKSEEIRRMLSDGATTEEVLAAIDCSEQYVRQMRHSMGLTNKRKTPNYTKTQAAKARELYRQGLSVSQIGLAMDRSPHRIRVYLRMKTSA